MYCDENVSSRQATSRQNSIISSQMYIHPYIQYTYNKQRKGETAEDGGRLSGAVGGISVLVGPNEVEAGAE